MFYEYLQALKIEAHKRKQERKEKERELKERRYWVYNFISESHFVIFRF